MYLRLISRVVSSVGHSSLRPRHRSAPCTAVPSPAGGAEAPEPPPSPSAPPTYGSTASEVVASAVLAGTIAAVEAPAPPLQLLSWLPAPEQRAQARQQVSKVRPPLLPDLARRPQLNLQGRATAVSELAPARAVLAAANSSESVCSSSVTRRSSSASTSSSTLPRVLLSSACGRRTLLLLPAVFPAFPATSSAWRQAARTDRNSPANLLPGGTFWRASSSWAALSANSMAAALASPAASRSFPRRLSSKARSTAMRALASASPPVSAAPGRPLAPGVWGRLAPPVHFSSWSPEPWQMPQLRQQVL
mmetsp:Transcript_91556/g.290399  ORF Transcript_91556/g.290399 Transcript_91556/m.290399 type:complete len:305 (+) Transcript_91556:615-1529(+)